MLKNESASDVLRCAELFVSMLLAHVQCICLMNLLAIA